MERQENDGPNPEEYRELLGLSYVAIRDVDGTETKQDALLDVLMRLEQWKKDNFDLPENDATFRDDWEKMVSEIMRPNRPIRTIHSLLGSGESRLKRIAANEIDPEAILAQFKIVKHKLKEVLIIPQTFDRVIVSGDGEWGPARFEPRLQSLIHALREKGIYTDDLIAYTGILLPGQMRKISYVLLEIPRVGSEILVCNEVGEATFVSKRHLGHETYGRLNKEELEALPGVSRHICVNRDAWTHDVIQALLECNEIQNKIDVQDMEEMGKAIRETYTAEQWVDFSSKVRRRICIHGKKLHAISTIFGVSGDVHDSNIPYLALAAKIYGEENEAIHERRRILSLDREGWIAEIKKNFPTSKDWFAIEGKRKRDIKVSGKALGALATVLGVYDDPTRSRLPYVEMAAKIYGEDDPFVTEKKATIPTLTPEETLEQIRSLYPTSTQWIEMSIKQKRELSIGGRGIHAITSLLGIEGNSMSRYVLIEIGAKLYGEDDVLIAEERRLESLDEAGWIAEIKKQYPTATHWLAMDTKQRDECKIGGRGLAGIAAILNTEGEANRMTEPFIRLGAKIYGENDPEIASKLRVVDMTAEEWILEIKKAYPSSASWIALRSKQRESIKVLGKGVKAIGTIFGITDNPAGHDDAYFELGAKIYGADDPSIAEKRRMLSLSKADWAAAIQKHFPTLEEWNKMSRSERRRLNIEGKTLVGIATVFGVEGDPKSNKDVFLLLGEKIYAQTVDSPPSSVPGE